ncbi:hypothetical protein BHM03_00038244 [Ensete ventricosum]|nr:hypothetical protein BHM03_00038244 [Ensete ventricosum]
MIEAIELQPDDGPRSSLSIGQVFGRCSGILLEFARRFVKGIGKLAVNTSGNHRKKTRRLTIRMLEATRLTGCVGSSSRVSEAYQDDANNGPKSSLGIGLGSDDAVGSRWEFARRFVEGIGKLAGNMKGDHREKTGGLLGP